MVQRLLLWVLTLIHEWTSRWLDRLKERSVPASRVRSHARRLPPPHWRALVASRAPQLLEPADAEDTFITPVAPARSLTAARPQRPPLTAAAAGISTNDRVERAEWTFGHVWRRRWDTRVDADGRVRSSSDVSESPARELAKAGTADSARPMEPQQPAAAAADLHHGTRSRRSVAGSVTRPRSAGTVRRTESSGDEHAQDRSETPIDDRRWPRLASMAGAHGLHIPDHGGRLQWPALAAADARERRFASRLADRDRRFKSDAEQRGTRWNA